MTNLSLKKTIAIGFMIVAFAIGASAQIKIGNIKIGGPNKPDPNKPDPNRPPTTNPPNTTPPNSNGNRPPTTVSNTTGGGATREEVNAFMADLRQFERDRMKSGAGGKGSGKGMRLLKNMATEAKKDNFAGCGADAAVLRMALDDGAAFAEIVKQKYPNIENPTWTNDPESMVGDYRRAAENRVEIAKTCITAKFAINLKSDVQNLEQRLAKFKSDPKANDGFILSLKFDDPAAAHARLVERYKDSFAVVGVTMPDDSVFAPYDAALKNFVDEAKAHAGDWKWYWNYHDAMIETKARAWFAKQEPKGTIVKIGMMHSDWQVDSVNGSIPKGRYKRGYVMYRKPGLQQCVVNSFSYEQDYMGGGRYNEMAVTSGMGNALRLQNCN